MEGKQEPDPEPDSRGGPRTAARQARAVAAPLGRAAAAWPLAGRLPADPRAWLAKAAALEWDRRTPFNLLPLAMAGGIILYFAADREPLWWGPPLAAMLAAALGWGLRRRPLGFALALSLAAAAAGMTAASWRSHRVAAPALERIMVAKLTGFVESVDERPGSIRLTLRLTALEGLPAERTPLRVRVTAPRQEVAPGAHVALQARLLPPPEPARPGGYDFARDSFFRGIGAVGSVLRGIEAAPASGPVPRDIALTAAIDSARNGLTQRIAGLIGGQAGAVAAALVTGKRGLISAETDDILRAAGLYHIVSISGLHMVLAAGALFWLVRAALALVPAIALGWPVKKIAAVAAMIGATGYCVFSGAEVATVRALVMTLVMLGAILFDRRALSMRNLAIAALVVMAREPEAVMGPSFQMSFGAVAALIALAEWQRARRERRPPEPAGPVWRALRLIGTGAVALVATTLAASLATAPFGAYHFQNFHPFGVLGNALALPFVSFGVMPAAVLGALLYPLGLDALAWWLMGHATAMVLLVSRLIAGLSGAVGTVPAFAPAALLLMALALCLGTILTTPLRLAALPAALGGVLLAQAAERPDILIERRGGGVAVRGADGRLAILGRIDAFSLEQWLRADGDGRRADDPTLRRGTACDPGGCVARLPDGRTVAHATQPETVAADCLRADIVVTPLRWDGACQALMADRASLERFGALAVQARPDGFAARPVRDPSVIRPWLRSPPPAAPARPEATPPLSEEDAARLSTDAGG